MPRGDSNLNMLIVAAILALGVGYYVPQTFSAKPTLEKPASADAPRRRAAPSKAAAARRCAWAASAPGRVEPAGGEVRIGAQMPGRIAEVLVALNDKVAAGDLLVRLDDEELIGAGASRLRPRLAIRKRERDNNEAVGQAGPGSPDGRGRRRQRRAAARAGPRRARSRAAERAARGTGDRSRPRQGARCREQGQGAARPGAASACARHSLSTACRRRPGPKRRCCGARRSSRGRRGARAHAHQGRRRPAPCCRSMPRPGETAAPSPENVLVIDRRSVVAAGAGRDRGARHRQGARRPGRDRALRRVPRQGLRGQDRLHGAVAGAEPARPARPAQAHRCRRAGSSDRPRRPAAAAAGHARRRVPEARGGSAAACSSGQRGSQAAQGQTERPKLQIPRASRTACRMRRRDHAPAKAPLTRPGARGVVTGLRWNNARRLSLR